MSGRAKFVFWWSGDHENRAYFNVLENDRGIQNGSTVSNETLINNYGIEPPTHPTFEQWRDQVHRKKRCGKCPAYLKGATDWRHHMDTNHKEFIQQRVL